MKKLFYILICLLFVQTLHAQTWQPLPMYGGGFITDVVIHPTDANTVVGVCDVGGVFISRDDCQNWTSHTANVPKTDFKNFYVRSFAFDPNTPTTQYYTSGDAPYQSAGKIWKTTNDGVSWTSANLPVNVGGNNYARYAGATLVVNTTNTNQIFVGGQPTFNYSTNVFNANSGLATSTDGGATWTKIGGTALDQTWITKISFSPANSNFIYISAAENSVNGVSTVGTGLWKYEISTNTLTQLTTNPVVDFDFDAVAMQTIITTSSAANRVSTDGGATWANLTTPSGLSYGLFAKAHPILGGSWFFGTFSFSQNTIVSTTDGGATWHQVKYSSSFNTSKILYPSYLSTNFQPSFGNYMAGMTFRANKAYLSDWYGVWRTADAAQPIANPSAAANDNSNWTWQFWAKGIQNMVQVRTSLHPTDPNRFYANVADLHYYESTDGGATMQYNAVAPMNMTCRIDFHKNNPSVGFMCGTKEHGDIGKIFKTTNGGASWSEIAAATFNGGAKNITDLQLADNVGTLVVGIERNTLPSSVYRSDDGGNTWTAWGNGITTSNTFRTWDKNDRLLKDADGQTFYVWRDNKLFRRSLTDAAWTQISLPIPANWIADAETHRTTAGTIFLSQYTVIYKSTDWGATWTSINTPSGVGSFAVSPSTNRLVFQSWDGNDAHIFYQSLDGGVTWNTLSTSGFWGMVSGLSFLNETKIIGWGVGNSGFSTELSVLLPAELVRFSGKKQGKTVILDWKTSSETNLKQFEIQRLETDWTTVGMVRARGQASAYTWADTRETADYYRLKMTDSNGDMQFSKIISIEKNETEIIKIYPNPFSDVLWIENLNGKNIQIFDIFGKKWIEKNNFEGKTLDTDNLPAGVYWLKLGHQTFQIFKQ